MSQFSCDVCAFESFDSYNATLWAIQNPWFQGCSSLAGALGEPQNQGKAPSSQLVPSYSGVFEGYQGHEVAPIPFDVFWGSLDQPALVPVAQGIISESVPGPSTSRRVLEDGCNYGGSNDNADDPETVADLFSVVPIFCRVGTCPYWHTDLKQVKRHRGGHFWGHFGYWCPNQTNTCPSLGGDFRRRDAVNAHCKRSPECGRILRANQGRIPQWGEPPNEQDLIPYDPSFHKPYRSSDGRIGRQ